MNTRHHTLIKAVGTCCRNSKKKRNSKTVSGHHIIAKDCIAVSSCRYISSLHVQRVPCLETSITGAAQLPAAILTMAPGPVASCLSRRLAVHSSFAESLIHAIAVHVVVGPRVPIHGNPRGVRLRVARILSRVAFALSHRSNAVSPSARAGRIGGMRARSAQRQGTRGQRKGEDTPAAQERPAGSTPTGRRSCASWRPSSGPPRRAWAGPPGPG